tara:strand:+ start:764 stop:952 length:189 start_codon:yes stop_codon:yes gene_type:complete
MSANTNPAKPFWRSKAVWLNVSAAALTIFIEYDNPLVIAQALALANIVLRFFTSTAVSPSLR